MYLPVPFYYYVFFFLLSMNTSIFRTRSTANNVSETQEQLIKISNERAIHLLGVEP
jgi:hypothetical protein